MSGVRGEPIARHWPSGVPHKWGQVSRPGPVVSAHSQGSDADRNPLGHASRAYWLTELETVSYIDTKRFLRRVPSRPITFHPLIFAQPSENRSRQWSTSGPDKIAETNA
jgi:hypothetical protein